MAFEKGRSGNPYGREKGSVNKATAAVKERIEQVLSDLDTTLTADLKALKPEQRVELWAKLQEFIRPKLSRTALAADEGTGRGMIAEVRIVSGYHDKEGNYVKCPPLRTSEKETEAEIEEDERAAAASLNRQTHLSR